MAQIHPSKLEIGPMYGVVNRLYNYDQCRMWVKEQNTRVANQQCKQSKGDLDEPFIEDEC